ncbi:LiaI-LiaF-like domain-containing protein [Metabacillus sp. 113a]|uniref:LiaI-LiaF-like domain-containing protein n=1 Tax=Metabacillus sp. 113a TaxID=3404706 RepID=UPI003CEB507F
MKNGHSSHFGWFLILIGLLFLVQSFGWIDSIWKYSWPVILLAISVHYHITFFRGTRTQESAGILVPAGVMLVLGLLFLFGSVTGWSYAGSTWPLYMLAAAVGLFELWLFGGRAKGLLIPVFFLTVFSLYFLARNLFPIQLIWPIVIIGLGLYYVLKTAANKNE